jgi:hypothetical protein
MNDYEMVCTDCAIFGSHKTHELKTLSDVDKDRRRRGSDIGKVIEECKYTLNWLHNDQYPQ